MGVCLNPDNILFTEAVNSEIYVDKTLLIREVNKKIRTSEKYLAVSRPRRFGKSMALHMLCAYYSKGCDSRGLFSGYKIENTKDFETHLNKYHVIQLNMRNFLDKADTVAGIIEKIRKRIFFDAKKEFPEIEWFDPSDLCEILGDIYDHSKTPIVFLIDEWDAIFRVKKWGAEAQVEYLNFIRNLLKDQPYAALVYMTGILPIKKYGEHSALNMFTEYSMTESIPLSEFMGFTKNEVKILSQKYKVPYNDIQSWYDGYQVDGIEIYNPRSVVQACIKKKFDNYWTKTETYEALKVYIEMDYDGLREKVIRMIAGEHIPINTEKFVNDMTTFHSADDVLTLLIHLGYLTYDFDQKEVFIPNSEVQQEFINSIEDKGWDEVMAAIRSSEQLLKATLAGDGKLVADTMEKIHRNETSILAYNDENALASVMSLAYYSARRKYIIYRELPSGNGFADLTFIPRVGEAVPAMVVELKIDKTEKSGLDQIKDKHYTEGLKAFQGEVLLVGISYDRGTKKHGCRIERIQIN